MRFSKALSSIAGVAALGAGSAAVAITEQEVSHVFDGRSFLYIEAEDFASLGADPDDNGWRVVSRTAPVLSTQGLDILPADSNVSGTALLDEVGGARHEDTALYEVRFVSAGVYQLYTRHSLYDSDGNGNFGNEDSFFVSPAFGLDSEGDWIGFAGLDFDENDGTVDIPIPGFALDPAGFKPAVGDSGDDGWYAIRDWGVKSQGVVTFPNDASTDDWNGNFHWYHRPAYVASNATGFEGDFGFKTEFVVAPGQVGQVLTFEIGTREAYGVFDGFLFIEDGDGDLLDEFSQAELDDALLPVAVPEPSFVAMCAVGVGVLGCWRRFVGSRARV